jgi:hypothetical protein
MLESKYIPVSTSSFKRDKSKVTSSGCSFAMFLNTLQNVSSDRLIDCFVRGLSSLLARHYKNYMELKAL